MGEFPPAGGFTPSSVNEQAGTSYAVQNGDANAILLISNPGKITLNVPASVSVGTRLMLMQGDAGQITLTPTGGATINSLNGALKTTGRYAVVNMWKKTATEWWAWGNLEITPLPIGFGPKLKPLLPASSGSRVFYVDASIGNDSNNGTSEATPWATLQDYFSGTAGPTNTIAPAAGDVVWVKDYPGQVANGQSSVGYRPGGANVDHVIDAKSGAAGDPITVKAWPGHRPIILGPVAAPGTQSRCLRIRNGSRYWKFIGFRFPYASGAKDPEGNEPCIYITAATTGNLEFWDCKIHGSTDGSGVLGETSAHDVSFINCESYANDDTRFIDGATHIATTTGTTTITITSFPGGARPSGASTVGSVVTGPGVPGGTTVVSVAADRNSYVVSNAIPAQAGGTFTVFDHGAQSHSYYLNATKDWQLINCIARDQANGYGFQIRNGAQGSIVAHGLAARIKGPGAEFAGYLIEGGGIGTNSNRAHNCVAYDTDRGWRQINNTATANRCHHNLSYLASIAHYQNQTVGAGWDWSDDESGNYDSPPSNNMTSDPSFTNPATNNWHPTLNSPCYAAGDVGYAPNFDFDGAVRVAATLGPFRAPEEV